jgi:hypothetical protein
VGVAHELDARLQQVLMRRQETTMERRYLRFVGKIWDTGEFEPGVGWETDRIARRTRCTPGHRLHLLNEAGYVVVEAGVELRAGTCQIQGAPGMTSQRVVGYLPLHPAGRTVVLLKGDRVVHEVELSIAAPRIAITSVDVEDDCVHVRWEAEHERVLCFNVVFVDAQRCAIQVAREVKCTDLTLATAEIPGGPECSLAVLATDGLRSAMIRSHPFDLPQTPPRVTIHTPVDGETLAADQPISLLGGAHDRAGRPVSDEHLVWSVNGEAVACGQRLTLAGPLKPGDHHVELVWACDGQPPARAAARVRVCERTAAQDAWLALASGQTSPDVDNMTAHSIK